MKRVLSLILVLTLIMATMVSAEEGSLKSNQFQYDGYIYTVGYDGQVGRTESMWDFPDDFVKPELSQDSSATTIGIFNDKMYIGFYNMHMGYFPDNQGWAVYDMVTEEWSGRPEGIPVAFSGIPQDFRVINGEMYVTLMEMEYDIRPTAYKTGDGVNWVSTDVLPLNEEIHSWAKTEINEAILFNLIPSHMQTEFKNEITRVEFCELIVNLIDEKTWIPMGEFYAQQGVVIGESPFTDTENNYVIIANALGIVGGKGNSVFDPNGKITRQEAAAMLLRTYKIYSKNLVINTDTFTDSDQFAPWAVEPINFIVGAGVMNGVGEGLFSPKETYTREQAYMTILRLLYATNEGL